MEKEIVCGRDNLKEFRETLKAEFPEFYLVIKSLYEAGMIDGLRGAKILPITDDSKKTENRPQMQKTTKYCKDCSSWHKDLIGDGYGAGRCDLNIRPTASKYPKTESCSSFNNKELLL